MPALWPLRSGRFVAGVLRFKRQAEELLERSGIPWVLLRPGRLTDGPYTSYDLNTLLQATSGQRQAVQVPPASVAVLLQALLSKRTAAIVETCERKMRSPAAARSSAASAFFCHYCHY